MSGTCTNTLFGISLPDLKSPFSVAYTNTTKTIDQYLSANGSELVNIYGDAYCASNTRSILMKNPDENEGLVHGYFNFNLKKFWTNRLKAVNQAAIDDKDTLLTKEHFIVYNGKSNFVFYNPDTDSYFTNDENPLTGKKTPVDIKLKDQDDGCYGMGLELKDGECNAWFACITSAD